MTGAPASNNSPHPPLRRRKSDASSRIRGTDTSQVCPPRSGEYAANPAIRCNDTHKLFALALCPRLQGKDGGAVPNRMGRTWSGVSSCEPRMLQHGSASGAPMRRAPAASNTVAPMFLPATRMTCLRHRHSCLRQARASIEQSIPFTRAKTCPKANRIVTASPRKLRKPNVAERTRTPPSTGGGGAAIATTREENNQLKETVPGQTPRKCKKPDIASLVRIARIGRIYIVVTVPVPDNDLASGMCLGMAQAQGSARPSRKGRARRRELAQ